MLPLVSQQQRSVLVTLSGRALALASVPASKSGSGSDWERVLGKQAGEALALLARSEWGLAARSEWGLVARS